MEPNQLVLADPVAHGLVAAEPSPWRSVRASPSDWIEALLKRIKVVYWNPLLNHRLVENPIKKRKRGGNLKKLPSLVQFLVWVPSLFSSYLETKLVKVRATSLGLSKTLSLGIYIRGPLRSKHWQQVLFLVWVMVELMGKIMSTSSSLSPAT